MESVPSQVPSHIFRVLIELNFYADHSNNDPYIESMCAPLNMTLSEISESNKVYKKILNHMMRNRYDRESLYNHEMFKFYLKNMLGYNSEEKIYNYMVFRHYYLIEDMNELVKEV